LLKNTVSIAADTVDHNRDVIRDGCIEQSIRQKLASLFSVRMRRAL